MLKVLKSKLVFRVDYHFGSLFEFIAISQYLSREGSIIYTFIFIQIKREVTIEIKKQQIRTFCINQRMP